MGYTRNRTLKEINEAMKKTKEAYDHYVNESWLRKANSTPDYKPVPKRGQFYDSENKEKFNAALTENQNKAMKAVHEYIDQLSREKVATPSAEALAAVQMFAMMDPGSLTKSEYADRIDEMMTKYGDSPITYETLRSLAAKQGIRDFKEHPLMAEKESARAMEDSIKSFFRNHALSDSQNSTDITDGEISFISLALDVGGVQNISTLIPEAQEE